MANYGTTIVNNVVIAKNEVILEKVGAHFTAIEDQNQNQILLYATRGNLVAKTAELIVIRLTDSGVSAPIVLASLPYLIRCLCYFARTEVMADKPFLNGIRKGLLLIII